MLPTALFAVVLSGVAACALRARRRRRRAEAALRHGEAFKSAILDSIDDAIAVLDRQGMVIAVNRAWTASVSHDGSRPQAVSRSGIGADYLAVWQAAERAQQVCDGIRAVLDGSQPRFTHEYACASATPQRWFGMDVTSLALPSGGAVVRHRAITHRRTLEPTLSGNAQQLQALSRRVLQVQETERQRIAHELHDEIAQALAAVQYNLESRRLQHGAAQADGDAASLRIVRDAMQRARRMAGDLRPSMLDQLGLDAALEWLAGQNAGCADPRIEFHPEGVNGRFEPPVEVACFRIAQEALANAIRHADARHVYIDLHHDGEHLELTIADDGRGFDPAARDAAVACESSLGLFGMRERAALIGAQLGIESAPGQGCKVLLRCPSRRLGEAA